MYINQNIPLLQKVYLSTDVYTVCLQHALSTEKEEVMGLLIGHIDVDNDASHISSCLILRRSDKQPDRVEISPEQLMAATTYAEQLTQTLQRSMRVVGWYHSHPHITVWPSGVDVRTQSLYQSMDSHFVGLIFSVFPNETRTNTYASKSNEIKLICFQSSDYERRDIPIVITRNEFSKPNLDMIAELPKILREEEEELALQYVDTNEQDDLLIHLHNTAQKLNAMIHITIKTARPIYEIALSRGQTNPQRICYLEKEKKRLMEELRKLDETQ